jgi:hypothetical protein
VTFDITKEREGVADDFWVKIESSGETKVDVACSDAFDVLSIKQGSEMTQDRNYKVGEKKRIPISLELDGEDNLAKDCEKLYYLSVSVIYPGEDQRKVEIASERPMDKICLTYDGSYEFSGKWNYENMQEYKDEIK